jgi:hypothetical protein
MDAKLNVMMKKIEELQINQSRETKSKELKCIRCNGVGHDIDICPSLQENQSMTNVNAISFRLRNEGFGNTYNPS